MIIILKEKKNEKPSISNVKTLLEEFTCNQLAKILARFLFMVVINRFHKQNLFNLFV